MDRIASSPPPDSARLFQELEHVAGLLHRLAKADWSRIAEDEAKSAVAVLERAVRHTSSIQSSVLTRVASSGAWEGDGQRTMSSWVTSRTGSTRNTAFKAVELARSLEEQLPVTKRALADGLISEEHAQVISRECTKSESLRERLADPVRGERLLVQKAQEVDASSFNKFAKGWAIEGDPRGADRAWRKERAKDSFTLTPTSEGYRAQGHLDPVSGALVQEAIDSFVGRKAADDERSLPERQAAALASLARQSLDAGFQLPNARLRPHLTITMDHTTLQRLVDATGPGDSERSFDADGEEGPVISNRLDYTKLAGTAPAMLPDGNPIPHAVLARLACQSTLGRVVFGPESTVLDVGREERIFPANHVRAIIARDQHCQYPGCDEGPNRSEVHHSLQWFKDNGPTHVDLGVLLCYFHHDLVHQRDITIRRRAGSWVFTHSGGAVILPPGRSSTDPPGSSPVKPPDDAAQPLLRGREPWGSRSGTPRRDARRPDRPGARRRVGPPGSDRSRIPALASDPADEALFDPGEPPF